MDEVTETYKDCVLKSAEVTVTKDIGDDLLKEINKHTLKPLTSDEVFVWKMRIVDNQFDRASTRFPASEVKKMLKLFVGTTVIKDHYNSADNQVGRIFKTEIVESNKSVDGETLTSLVAHAYMLKNDANKSLIADINGGIKKEVSLSVIVESVECSICKTNKVKKYCQHYAGEEFDGVKCHYTYHGVKDAHELSFVAVPSFKNAGVIKHLVTDPNLGLVKEESVQKDAEPIESNEDVIKARLRTMDGFIFVEKTNKN